MHVVAANLSLRFYKDAGWTQEALDSCLRKGEVELDDRIPDMAYYRLTIWSAFDVDKLMKHVTSIDRVFNQSPNKSDMELIEEYNWR